MRYYYQTNVKMSQSEGIDIGFVDECEPWKVESRLFPSKVGGKPAWLNLENLPQVADLQCGLCGQQLIFLCQVYAPYEEDENNFHRTLFLFICRNSSCCQNNATNNVKVFRSHLQRQNKFYSEEPPAEQPDENFKLSKWTTLCNLCGCLAEKHCGKCKESYCSREHQLVDWKESHKNLCGKNSSNKINSKLLFHEYELTIEPEIRQVNSVDEEKQLEEFEKIQNEGQTGTMAEISEIDLEAHASVDADKTFSQFRKRIGDYTDQVLRYERGGTPLWIAKEPKPEVIPNCEYCGGPRQFEFQIMPQMLTMLEESELDWGILVVYTCKSSCTDTSSYKQEFIFKQDISVDKTN